MFELTPLTHQQILLCLDTVSANTFYMIVGDALLRRKSLSVIRMGDGEHRFWQECQRGKPGDLVGPTEGRSDDWLAKLGCSGITNECLLDNLQLAAESCTYFAPSISGIWNEDYDVSISVRRRYVDNFFVNSWTEEMKVGLFKQAGHVLFIHGNAETADAMQINAAKIGVKVTFLKLTKWQEADAVVAASADVDAPLVLFSAGPASKWIGPVISKKPIPRVVLDLGNSADQWTLNG